MNLTELKNTPVSELIALGENMGLENLARMRKQDIIFSILKQHAKSGEDIFGDGVLETVPTLLVPMISMFLQVKFAVLTFALVTPSQGKFVLLKKVSVILPS